MRHIHRLVVEEQAEQADILSVDGLANGMGVGRAEDDEGGWEDMRFWEYLQTGQLCILCQMHVLTNERRAIYRLSPHLLRHIQWKVCEQGTVMRPVTAISILSRQTGHVGSSYMLLGDETNWATPWDTVSSVWSLTERTCTTLQISGWNGNQKKSS